MSTISLGSLANNNCSSNGCVIRTGGATGKNPIRWGKSDSGEPVDGNTRIQKTGKFYNGIPVFRYWKRTPDGTITHEDKAYCKDCPPTTKSTPITPVESTIPPLEFTDVLKTEEFFSNDTPPEIPEDNFPSETFDRFLLDDSWLCTLQESSDCPNDVSLIHSEECTDKRNWYRLNGSCTNDLLYRLRYRNSTKGSVYTLFDVAYDDLVKPFFDKFTCSDIQVQTPKTQIINIDQDTPTTARIYIPWVDTDIQQWNIRKSDSIRYCYNKNVLFFYLGQHPNDVETEIQWTASSMLQRMKTIPNTFNNVVRVQSVTGVNTCAMPLGTKERYDAINQNQSITNYTPNLLCPLPRDRFQELSNDSPLGYKRLTGYNPTLQSIVYDPSSIDRTLKQLQFERERSKRCFTDFTGELCVPFEHLQVDINICTGLSPGLHYFAMALVTESTIRKAFTSERGTIVCQPSLIKMRVYDKQPNTPSCGVSVVKRQTTTIGTTTKGTINTNTDLFNSGIDKVSAVLPDGIVPNRPATDCIELIRKRTCDEYNNIL